jgi:hypothetical protein
MNRYFVPLGRIADYAHPAPQRTAYRAGRSWDSNYEFRVWTSRGAMLQACAMGRGELGSKAWKPFDERWSK